MVNPDASAGSETFREPSRAMSLHLHGSVRVKAGSVTSFDVVDFVQFGELDGFAIYFPDSDATRLANLDRLLAAATELRGIVAARIEPVSTDTPLGLEDDKAGAEQ